ncbi:hypothetical protein [Streptomyces buecherae]|uniref:Uncharacterized protein n=1 Tax=Streptomyces buecherae TaxID=2763006 RepID=A0A7H8NEQ8_9ACTN|nr:hypothetical protein [Streptomyces buecherae]QKW52188.1 hypothetical protein HUT08_24595 [Streptomyces buecherae]
MSTFDEEWASIRRGPSAGAADMRLASAEASDEWSGGGQDGVKSDRAAWNAAGGSVGALRSNVAKALTALEHGQGGAQRSGAHGVASAQAQHEAYVSWQRYLKAVGERCEAVQSQLKKAGAVQHANDRATRGAFDGMNDQYADTPTVGGQGRAR